MEMKMDMDIDRNAPKHRVPPRSRPTALARARTLLSVALLVAGCGVSRPTLKADLAPLALEPASAAPLEQDLFRRDTAGSIGEDDLRRVLAAPVYLEDRARVGVVPVAATYGPLEETPLVGTPGELAAALESSGLFEVSTEVSTEWPADGGIAGLRELAARYRAEYLLLYRERFVDRSHTNAWAWSWPTLLGIFVTPARTIETAGVLETTLLEVKTGTLLFTVYERVSDATSDDIWNNDETRREQRARLTGRAAARLAQKVVTQARRLAAARPRPDGVVRTDDHAAPEERLLDTPEPVSAAR